LFENYQYRSIDVQPAFERFESGSSLPDIDIDFDDEGRADGLCDSKIRVETSGKLSPMVKWQPNRQFDTARVLDLPLFEADKIAN
jgi:DNA polymerase-3 subunit alpha